MNNFATNVTSTYNAQIYTSGKQAYEDLLPVLIKCFFIISVGFISAKCSLISAKGSIALNTFMSYFSLPSLIFSSIVTLDFSGVRWAFLASVFIAKSLIFISVALVTLLLTRPTNSGLAGLYAIFCTQSNDFALGYPLISSLYKTKCIYFAQYIYLLAPIQLLILNPIGFFMMEINKQQCLNGDRKSLFIPVVKGIVTNPIVVLTALGIAGNFAFQRSPPKMLMDILETFAVSFSALALFQLGHNMVGKSGERSNYGLTEPAILILMKILVLPLLIRELVNQLPVGFTTQEKDDFGSFGFLYGTFPTAPSVFLYASQFNLDGQVVAKGMVACTVLSAPLMIISATMTMLPVSDFKEFRETLIQTVFWTSTISIACCAWVLITLIVNHKFKSITHSVTMQLTITQIVTGIGGLMWYFIDSENKTLFYSQYIISAVGIFSTRIWTAFLAGILAFLRWRSLCYVLSYRIAIIAIGYLVSVVATVALIVGIFYRPPQKYIPDPNFQFGQPEAYVAFAVLAACLLFTILCLIIQQRFRYQTTAHYKLLDGNQEIQSEEQETEPEENNPVEPPPTAIIPDIEDMSSLIIRKNNALTVDTNCAILCDRYHGCSERVRRRCTSEVRQYLIQGCQKEEIEMQHELNQHVVLLILLSISMTVGLSVCIWKIIGEDKTGIFVELEFLDVILNFGQGIFTFAVFAFDYTLIKKPILAIYKRIRYGNSSFVIPPFKDLKPATVQVCHQFKTYHYDTCVSELVSDKRVGRKVHESAFRGKELVTWLLAVGLADDRIEAEAYGKELVLGRIIEHVERVEDFADDIKIFRFASSVYENGAANATTTTPTHRNNDISENQSLTRRSNYVHKNEQDVEVLIHIARTP